MTTATSWHSPDQRRTGKRNPHTVGRSGELRWVLSERWAAHPLLRLALLAEDRRNSDPANTGKRSASPWFGAANATGKTSEANAGLPLP